MSSKYDPLAEFASFVSPAPAPRPPSPTPAPFMTAEESKEKKPVMNSATFNNTQQPPIMMNQFQQMQQPPLMNQQNPFSSFGGVSYSNPSNDMAATSQFGMMNYQSLVPATQQQQPSAWSIQSQPPQQQQQLQQQQLQQQPMGLSMQQQSPAPVPFASAASFNGFAMNHVPAPAPIAHSPAPPVPSPAPTVPSPAPTTFDHSGNMMMVPTSSNASYNNQFPFSSPGSVFSPSPTVVSGGNSTVAAANVGFGAGAASSPNAFFGASPVAAGPPVPSMTHQKHSAPSAVIQEDDDFFGEFSNSVQEKSPSRPPSVFEANENDDVSYLSKSTGGTDRVPGPHSKVSPLDDPKFAPKPNAVHGLENAKALSQHAPPGASPLPDFEKVTHSGYVLSRISFRTILIKKWKQTFWVSYGNNQVLFFRSSSDFEDWVSNPYLSQGQRDFLVKLKVDFVEDLHKQGVRGYQCTPQRLKNYNNQML